MSINEPPRTEAAANAPTALETAAGAGTGTAEKAAVGSRDSSDLLNHGAIDKPRDLPQLGPQNRTIVAAMCPPLVCRCGVSGILAGAPLVLVAVCAATKGGKGETSSNCLYCVVDWENCDLRQFFSRKEFFSKVNVESTGPNVLYSFIMDIRWP